MYLINKVCLKWVSLKQSIVHQAVLYHFYDYATFAPSPLRLGHLRLDTCASDICASRH
jgi:hypothetical protein